MNIQYVDVSKEFDVTPEPNTVVGHFFLKDGKLSLDSLPKTQIHDNKIVTLGMALNPRQLEIPASTTLAMQAFLFKSANPKAEFSKMILPHWANGIDEVIAYALLDEKIGNTVAGAGEMIQALLMEALRYMSNPFLFAQNTNVSILNNLLNEFPYPSKKIDGQNMAISNEYYIYERATWLAMALDDNVVPQKRIYPDIPHEIIYENDMSVLILLQSDSKFGVDEIIAQQYFDMNTKVQRAIVVRKLFKSTNSDVRVYNARLRDDNFDRIDLPSMKAINTAEAKAGSKNIWQPGRGYAKSPYKGTCLPLKDIWQLCQLQQSDGTDTTGA